MIKNAEFLSVCLSQLRQIEVGECLVFKTAKKDRQIEIFKKGLNLYMVLESGFEKQSFEIEGEQALKKLLKTLQKREFPHCKQLWLQRK